MFHGVPVFTQSTRFLRELADKMQEGEDAQPTVWGGVAEPRDNPSIPAGFTYLGQFIDHDITFDPNSSLQRMNDPEALENFRTPRFDLDSLYGRGPADDPFLYDQDAPEAIKLLTGRMTEDDGSDVDEVDLPRNRQGRALIGDPRNDENTFIAQLHLLFIFFHNACVDHVTNEGRLENPQEIFQGGATARPLALPVGGRARLPAPDRDARCPGRSPLGRAARPPRPQAALLHLEDPALHARRVLGCGVPLRAQPDPRRLPHQQRRRKSHLPAPTAAALRASRRSSTMPRTGSGRRRSRAQDRPQYASTGRTGN
jgi:hypothetical protein